jgi:magnesium transporter
MLTIHSGGKAQPLTWQSGTGIPADAVWLDLCQPDAAETKACEDAAGLRLPRREDIRGVGLAGRNRCLGDALFLQMSSFADAEDEQKRATPLSLVLTPHLLVSQRYARSGTFDTAASQWHETQRDEGPTSALAEIIETMAERTAQSMEKVAGEVADLSRKVFTGKRDDTRKLRRWLVHVGHLEARLAGSRGSLLGITRIVAFICENHPDWIPEAASSRISMVRNDLKALDEFDEQLTGKLQFLLDSIFGFISVNQNSVMKLFTVVAVAAFPPTVLAGIWGMNFKYMPALSQPWGYAMALAAIALSILIPLAIFKWRGWLSRD